MIKVNAIVDEGIAPLVLALNALPIWTLDSCQGGKGRSAHIYFRYLGPKNKELYFVALLAKAMVMECEEEDLFAVSLEWRTGTDPLGQIVCAPEAVIRVSDIVRSVAASDRMTAFLCDTRNKALRS